MRIISTSKFDRKLKTFPKTIREKFYKQVDFLILDIRYPSLHAKKYSGEENIWQGRVDKNVRFYFQIENDFYVLVDIKYHN